MVGTVEAASRRAAAAAVGGSIVTASEVVCAGGGRSGEARGCDVHSVVSLLFVQQGACYCPGNFSGRRSKVANVEND